jgi:hypothetical protein
MFKWLTIICAGLFVYESAAQVKSPDMFASELQHLRSSTHYSVTRQFIVFDPGPPDVYTRPMVVANTNQLLLDPSLLTVSCERIKKALLTELGLRDQWQGKITLQTHPIRSIGEEVVVTSTRYANQWNYRVDLPERMEAGKLVSAMVQVLLLEIANRSSEGRSAEIPLWLTEGMARQLILSSDVDLVIQAPGKEVLWFSGASTVAGVSRLMRDERMQHPLKDAHEDLSQLPPLTLYELSWPKDNQLRGEYGEAYRSSAQVLVYDLLALPNGRALMTQFISQLPDHLNWQIAFRTAFQPEFATQRDFEKWWALRLVNFTGRDLSNIWPLDESLRKLDEVVRPSVQVRMAADELPLRSEVNLQTIVSEWDFVKQAEVLDIKIKQLTMLRGQVAHELVPLVDGYRKILEEYLQKRNKGWFARLIPGQTTPGLDKVARQINGQLDLLDRQREQMGPKTKPGDTVQIERSGNSVSP